MLTLFLPVGILVGAGLIALLSISAHLFFLQLIWFAIGIGIVVLFYFVDWRIILNYRWMIGGLYALSLVLLLAVQLGGPLIRNTRSWLALGPFNFQPVELVKVVLIVLYANYFSRKHLSIARWRNILRSFIFFLVPAGLVAIQPDLGSALVLFGIWFGFLIVSGLPLRRLAVALLGFATLGFVMWVYLLQPYQRERIVGVFYPDRNTLGINYSVTQSKIAIGSAGFWGKGYGQGTQVQLGFLPEPTNDFVLAAIIEEWGVFAALIVIGSFLCLIWRILRIGSEADRNFEKFICLGVAMVFGIQFFLNSGSELGLLPVIGVTFPFVSYGGSNLVVSFFLLALVNAIDTQKGAR